MGVNEAEAMQADLATVDRALIAAVQNGLPLVSHPYAQVGRGLGLSEAEVIARLAQLRRQGVIKRMGVVVRHRELGYRANAMVVWDIPDNRVDALGACMGQFEFVSLCYRRPRRLPDWPYNLFCMIHGRDRDAVLDNVRLLAQRCALEHVSREVLFSRRRFKQRGARYGAAGACGAEVGAGGPGTLRR
jgi:DNA-binding Lrp family transcriptional regulator